MQSPAKLILARPSSARKKPGKGRSAWNYDKKKQETHMTLFTAIYQPRSIQNFVNRHFQQILKRFGVWCGRTLTLPFHPSALILGVYLIFLSVPGMALGQVTEVTIMLPGDVPMVLVKIPAGTFQMGSPNGERGSDVFNNEPQHQVTLTQDYYLGKTEVTQQQWQAVTGTPMRTNCGAIAVGDKYPVYCVTWDRIAGPGGFLEKLNAHIGSDEFRLATEAEWEYAARAGTTTRFSHGDILQCGDDCEACAEHDPFMWWCGNNTPAGPKLVGQKQPNPFGLHDMHGNLWEIVNDLYGDTYGSASGQPVIDPMGPANGFDRIIVGGGAVSEAKFARSASRISSSPK
jgi:formylglycine-generating enzyme required for sulfatase activity